MKKAGKVQKAPTKGTRGRKPSNGHATAKKNSGVAKQESGAGKQNEEEQQQNHTETPLEKFFIDQLKDIFYTEQQQTKVLKSLEEAATTDELKEAFDDHLHLTQKHIKRLERVFKFLGKQPEGKSSEAIDGLARECEVIIKETPEGSMTRDAALIIAAQKVEHYEIATYGGLVQLALTMELYEVADLLDMTLTDEETSDLMLTDIAESAINIEAEQEGTSYSWMLTM